MGSTVTVQNTLAPGLVLGAYRRAPFSTVDFLSKTCWNPFHSVATHGREERFLLPMASAITQKTITTRTLPIDPDPQARSTPDFWEYIEKLKPEEWSRHIVYIYRTDPRASNYGDGQSNIDKCPGYIEMRDGTQVPFNDREEVERAIQEKHGGKAFRLIVKRGHERVTEGKCCNDAPPKYMHQSFPSNGNGNGT